MGMSKSDAARAQTLVAFLLGRDDGNGERITPEAAELALQSLAAAAYAALGGGVRADEVLVGLAPDGRAVPWVPMPDGCPGESCVWWRAEHTHSTAELDTERA